MENFKKFVWSMKVITYFRDKIVQISRNKQEKTFTVETTTSSADRVLRSRVWKHLGISSSISQIYFYLV